MPSCHASTPAPETQTDRERGEALGGPLSGALSPFLAQSLSWVSQPRLKTPAVLMSQSLLLRERHCCRQTCLECPGQSRSCCWQQWPDIS